MKNFRLIALTIVLLCLSKSLVRAQSLSEQLNKHVTYLASDELDGRGLGTKGKELAVAYIEDQMKEAGLQPFFETYRQEFSLQIELAKVAATNVVGFIPGSDPNLKDEYIVFGAHFDHLGYRMIQGEKRIYPGADDNASGVAGIIEIARQLAAKKDQLKRSVIFIAFDAEESGLLGASHFVNSTKPIENSQIKAMFSLDMIGMYGKNEGLSLKGIGHVAGAAEMASQLAAEQNMVLKKLPQVKNKVELRTDTWPFAEAGIPAFHPFTGLVSPYHKPEDKANLLEYNEMAKVVDYLSSLGSEMANAESLQPAPSFRKAVSDDAFKVIPGAVLYLGSSQHVNRSDLNRTNATIAFKAGAFVQIDLVKWLSVQPEVLYDFHGAKYASGTWRRQSLTVPVNLQINLVKQNAGSMRIFPIIGGYYRMNFAGKQGGQSLDFETTYNKSEIGYNFGIGFIVNQINFSFIATRGIDEVFRSNPTQIYQSGAYLSLGWRFGQGGL